LSDSLVSSSNGLSTLNKSSFIKLDDGSFLVTWSKPEVNVSNQFVFVDYGQKLSSTGEKVGNEFLFDDFSIIKLVTLDDVSKIKTEALPTAYDIADDNIVRIKTEYFIDQYNRILNTVVSGQKFTTDGSKTGNEFEIHSYSASSFSYTDYIITELTNGNFVATWKKFLQILLALIFSGRYSLHREVK
jgi:hypothetical protein